MFLKIKLQAMHDIFKPFQIIPFAINCGTNKIFYKDRCIQNTNGGSSLVDRSKELETSSSPTMTNASTINVQHVNLPTAFVPLPVKIID